MKLTAFTDYSLRALMYLAVHPERLCTAKEIAETFQISQNHMVKVAYQLSKLGYVETQKGKNGG
ncbi:MAG: Rrf2 family transcriptional regulator, partial [Pseudomonadales bacterium]